MCTLPSALTARETTSTGVNTMLSSCKVRSVPAVTLHSFGFSVVVVAAEANVVDEVAVVAEVVVVPKVVAEAEAASTDEARAVFFVHCGAPDGVGGDPFCAGQY